MRPFRSILAAGCAALVAALTLAGAGDAEARRRQRDEPADFDFYLMVFSIAPSFCRLVGDARGKRQCYAPSDADYRATPLTVHGLWPNRKNRSVNQQPAFCSNEALALSPELRRKLRVYMPGMADGLQEHEAPARRLLGPDAGGVFRQDRRARREGERHHRGGAQGEGPLWPRGAGPDAAPRRRREEPGARRRNRRRLQVPAPRRSARPGRALARLRRRDPRPDQQGYRPRSRRRRLARLL